MRSLLVCTACIALMSAPAFANTACDGDGDLTIWDNRAVLHRGRPWDGAKHKRILHRTTVAGEGSGTELVVRDALYFYDGFGISGEMGDRIQLEGSTETAVIVNVDYASNTLTLDRALSWEGGQGVSLAFAGSAPDVGMYER